MRVYLFVALIAALVTYVTTPAARRLARRIGAVTPVRERDVHTVPIPRLGGTAIFLGIAIALLTAGHIPFLKPVYAEGNTVSAVLLGAAAITLLGVADDLWQLDAVTKLAGQALIATGMAWQGIQLVSLPIFGTFIPSRGVLIGLTVLVIVVTINAVNFVDGLDGLAAGIVAIAAAAFFVYSYKLTHDSSPKDLSSLASLIAVALVGACIGFLPHNFNPARIFMGDSGSMLLGLLLATSTVAITGRVDPLVLEQSRGVPVYLPLLLPLAVLALPLIDLLLAIVRRTRAGRMPWQPDKMHLHHRLLGLGHSHAHTVLILYFWTATVAFGVALFAILSPAEAFLVGGVAVLAALVLTIGPARWRRAVARRVTPTGPAPDTGSATDPGPAPGTAPGTSPDTAPAGLAVGRHSAVPDRGRDETGVSSSAGQS